MTTLERQAAVIEASIRTGNALADLEKAQEKMREVCADIGIRDPATAALEEARGYTRVALVLLQQLTKAIR